MSLLEFAPPKKYLELIEQFRLIDDTFFDVCFDGSNECMQLLLRIFFNRDDIMIKEVVTQRSAQNLYGRSARFDVIAVDNDGKIYNVEIQRANEGANPKRARFNHSLIDSREINKGTKYENFPEVWGIFSSAPTLGRCTILNWPKEPTFSNIKTRGLKPCVN